MERDVYVQGPYALPVNPDADVSRVIPPGMWLRCMYVEQGDVVSLIPTEDAFVSRPDKKATLWAYREIDAIVWND